MTDIQQGDTVIIPTGTEVRSRHPARKSFVTKRKMKIKVHHLLEGFEISIYWFHLKREEYPQFAEYFDKYDELIMEAQTNPESALAAKAHEKARNIRLPVSNGRVCWPGSGGYWNEVETSLVMRDLPDVQVDNDLSHC